jgi:hypothetical protein
MTQQVINIGVLADDGTGDDLRSAFNKCNLNFSELYGTGTSPLGGGVRVASLTTTPVAVAPANALRHSIVFHNPGTITIYVAPQTVLAFDNSVVTLVPSLAALQGCFVVLPGAMLKLVGSCGGQWSGFAASGTAPLTIQDNAT